MPEFKSENLDLSYSGNFPDNLKVIKTINAFPVEITAVGTLNPRTNQFGYCLGVKDTLINGRITYNRERNSVEYRKALPLPLPGISGLTRPVLAAEWELGSNWRKVPRLQLGLAVTDDVQSGVDDGATLSSSGVAFRKKAFITNRWGVEVDGDVNIKLSRDVTAAGAGGNSLHFHLGAKELNLVLRL